MGTWPQLVWHIYTLHEYMTTHHMDISLHITHYMGIWLHITWAHDCTLHGNMTIYYMGTWLNIACYLIIYYVGTWLHETWVHDSILQGYMTTHHMGTLHITWVHDHLLHGHMPTDNMGPWLHISWAHNYTLHGHMTIYYMVAWLHITRLMTTHLTSLQRCFLFRPLRINSLWPSDIIWRHEYWSTLVRVVACCPRAPCHDLNQFWLIINMFCGIHLRATLKQVLMNFTYNRGSEITLVKSLPNIPEINEFKACSCWRLPFRLSPHHFRYFQAVTWRSDIKIKLY